MKNHNWIKHVSLFLLLILFGLINNTWARDLYVDGSNPLASDVNNGSATKPFKTIGYAAKNAVAGDTVHVQNGVYREFVEVENSGTGPNKMITFKADGNKVYVKGSDVVTGWVLYGNNIWRKEGWLINSQQVFVDGDYLVQIGGNALFSPDRLPAKGRGTTDMIAGSFYYDESGKNLFVRLKDNGNPNKHLMEVSTRALLLRLKWKNYIKIFGFNFLHSNNTATIKSGWPAVAINGDNCVIENNNFSWCDFTGLGGNGNNHIIKNNTANYNGNSGMSFSGSGISMVGNVTNYNNYRNFDPEWHAGGVKNVKLVNSSIRNHVSLHNYGHGIWCDIDCNDVIIDSNKVQENEGTGIFYEISEKAQISNNIIFGNKLHGIYISASSNCNIINNLVHANMRGVVVHGVPRSAFGKKYVTFNNNIYNNIISENSNADIVFARKSESFGDNYSDYNLFFQSKSQLVNRIDYAAPIYTLAQWRALTSNDIHSIAGDPYFVNKNKYDFRLSSKSPAIGTGKNNNLVVVDMLGNKRSLSKDIGPFVYIK